MNSIKILTDLIGFKTISGEDNNSLIDYCDNILKDLGASSFRTFDEDKKRVKFLIENHELFPEKTNVTFAQILDKRNILVNVWERGAGLTKACGTAACATAAAGNNNKFVENKVAIKFKEGVLNIVLDEKNNIFMTGPVSEIKNIKVEI